jgi:hypothetical protein
VCNFRGFFLRSSHVLTKDTDLVESARPIHYSTPVAKLTYMSVYDNRDVTSETTPSPSPLSSLTHVHKFIGSLNPTCQTLSNSARLTCLSVYDNRDGASEPAPSPSPPSLLSYVHRCIGSRNPTCQTLPNSTRLTYLSVHDNRDDASCLSPHPPRPPPPRSVSEEGEPMHLCTCVSDAHTCTQVHRFSQPYLTDVVQLILVCVSYIYCRVPVYCVYVLVIVDFLLLSFKLILG